MSALAVVPPRAAPKPRLVIDPVVGTVTVDGTDVDLTQKEYELLLALARDPAALCEKEDLMSEVWSIESKNSRTLDSHASRLRAKLGCDGRSPDFVINKWGRGYRLVPALRKSEVLVIGSHSPESALGAAALDAAVAMEKMGITLARLGAELQLAGRSERSRLEGSIASLRRERQR